MGVCVCEFPNAVLPRGVQVEVSPLENAIEVIENKNQQLRTLIAQCQSRQMQNINPLTMCLNGVIDAAVNGGLARYQEVGLTHPLVYIRVNVHNCVVCVCVCV